MQKQKHAFTLVELMVSITIFALIFASVMTLFLFSSQMSQSSEFQRVIQENTKLVLEDIAEEVRVSDTFWLEAIGIVDGTCSSSGAGLIGGTLCVSNSIRYTVGNKQGDHWEPISDISLCRDTIESDDEICRILKKENGSFFPLTNNRVALNSLQFEIVNAGVPKILIHFQMRPAYGKGLQKERVDMQTIEIQTTLSKRIIESY